MSGVWASHDTEAKEPAFLQRAREISYYKGFEIKSWPKLFPRRKMGSKKEGSFGGKDT